MMDNWITTSQALEIAVRFKKGPHGKNALIYAGKKCGFLEKRGKHLFFNKYKLICYCKVSNRTTLKDIAEKSSCSIGKVYYTAMKNNIRTEKQNNRKYISDINVIKLLNILLRSKKNGSK